MSTSATEDALARIAAALERLVPPAPATADLDAHPAYRWDGKALSAIEAFEPIDYALLTGIEAQKAACLENTRRLAKGHAAHDILLWGARGTGKSATVAACVGQVQKEGLPLAMVEIATDDLRSLALLFSLLRQSSRPIVLYIDDLGFDGDFGADARALRSLLQGGASARGSHVRLYATSNRRHIVPRSMGEQDDPINPRDVVDDRLALSDRFGLSLGFHALDQDAYVAIVRRYAERYGLEVEPLAAIQWATQRGSRSGRVAWQYVVELAGRAGRTLEN
ncbi:MAG: ATP-binding protein [Alphaproteobacteria bacterium]|nr:ATP-binding protein [Alphaproteobacteria bacterium]MBU0795455.1 ATP-binding protein [Alphaproteobacteria bacterium]MBU0875743.1 ATP-binding protein [Alphaproteobacteria bacterium]MBU1769066.1 ATP-binding protein [Alphaproteobacteria bacterium]